MTCTCPQLHAGLRPTGARNWNYKCPEHGTDSDWYASPGQVEKRDRQNERPLGIQFLTLPVTRRIQIARSLGLLRDPSEENLPSPKLSEMILERVRLTGQQEQLAALVKQARP